MTPDRAAAERLVITLSRVLERCAQYGHPSAAAHRDLDEAIERRTELVRSECRTAVSS